MFKKVLVPLDGSHFAESALPLALDVARRAGGRIRLMIVRELDPQVGYELWTPLADEWSQTYLEGVAESLEGEAEPDVTTLVATGHVPESIEAAADEWGADLVVLASHGRGGLSRAWLGSVTDAFVRHSSRPVMVVRPPEEEVERDAPEGGIRRILIAVDGSALAEKIILPAKEVGALFGSSFHLVRVVPFPRAPTSSYIPHAAEMNRERVSEAEEEAQAYLDGLTGQLVEEGLETSSAAVVTSQAARGILAEAAAVECDLIAMATHGRGALRRTFLGSTTDKVLRATDRSVLLIHPMHVE
ncbi:MAG: universal stress protein [Gemmatimonadota bacterium]